MNALSDQNRELQSVISRLQTAYAAAVTAVAALERQAVDLDIEIAQALTRCVLNPIAAAMEFLKQNKPSPESG